MNSLTTQKNIHSFSVSYPLNINQSYLVFSFCVSFFAFFHFKFLNFAYDNLLQRFLLTFFCSLLSTYKETKQVCRIFIWEKFQTLKFTLKVFIRRRKTNAVEFFKKYSNDFQLVCNVSVFHTNVCLYNRDFTRVSFNLIFVFPRHLFIQVIIFTNCS